MKQHDDGDDATTRREKRKISFFLFFYGRWKRNNIIHLPLKKVRRGRRRVS
jgi:hypothetical protein